MRTTKIYSIAMPPNLAKQAERLASKGSRTMSELMREAFRRYAQDAVLPKAAGESGRILKNLSPPPTF